MKRERCNTFTLLQVEHSGSLAFKFKKKEKKKVEVQGACYWDKTQTQMKDGKAKKRLQNSIKLQVTIFPKLLFSNIHL